MTEYVVLMQQSEDSTWVLVGGVKAHSAMSAIQGYVSHHQESDGVYIAIPARSWNPLTVAVEQTTRIRVGEAE